jgi:prolyl oligopeptidase
MLRISLVTFACLLGTCAQAQNSFTAPASIAKPAAAKVEPVTDTYFGTAITDPYRWMETTPATPGFIAYLHTQSDYSAAVFAKIPGHDALLARIRQLDGAVGKVTEWHGAGGKIFFLGNKAGEPTFVLMVQEANGTIRTLLDPAALATGDTHASISYFAPSPDGAYVAVGVALAGNENATLHIVDTASGRLLPDAIDRTFGALVSWHSSTSFFYTRLQKLSPQDPPAAYFQNQRVYLHTLGADPEAEPVVYGPGAPSSPDAPINGFREVIETPGSPWLIARVRDGTSEPSTLLLKRITMSQTARNGKPLSTPPTT